MLAKIIAGILSVLRRTQKILVALPLMGMFAGAGLAFAASPITLPFYYHFADPGILHEASSATSSGSLYWWLSAGDHITVVNSIGATPVGATPSGTPAQKKYATQYPTATDQGSHPQNVFQMFLKDSVQNPSAQIYFNRIKDNLSNAANRQPFIGESVLARYIDDDNYYYGGIRTDGYVVIKKKYKGVYQTLASKKVLAGTYNTATNYDLIPLNKWIGLKFVVTDSSSGPHLSLYTDMGRTGTWTLALNVTDDAAKFGSPVSGAGLVGIKSDFADAQFDEFLLSDIAATSQPLVSPSPAPTPPPSPAPAPATSYDSLVMADKPVMYLKMNSMSTGKENDASGNGHSGTYKGGTPASAKLPNGDNAAVFNGTSEYLTVPTSPAFSIPTTHKLTWEAWIRPDTLNFSESSNDYIDWMGKCENYSPTCEWEARLYNAVTSQNRPNRLSAYVFNSSAGLGSGSDWQPASSIISAGKWLHVVAEYQLDTTPSLCSSAHPGTINIWVNGVQQSFSMHAPTGCMSQFSITPKAGNSPLTIGTMAMDTWFKGAVAKVAIYDHLLTSAQISAHYKAMAGKSPSGSCGQTCTATMP